MRYIQLTALLLVGSHLSFAVDVELAQGSYTAKVGDTVELVVSLSEPVPNGLEGYALLLNFPQNFLSVTGIEVVPQLDYDLFDDGALLDAGNNFASVAGFVEFGQPAYTGTTFVTFNLLVTSAATPGTYSLQLAPLLEQGTSFVDGNGDAIDALLTFGSATLEIFEPLPEEYIDDLSVELDGNDVSLRFTGTAGRSYRIQYSSTLEGASWQDLGTYTAPVGGIVEAVDSSGVLASPRFYRVVDP